MENNLAYMARRKLKWATVSYCIQGSVVLSKGIDGSVENVGNLADFRQGMSTPINQAQCSTSVF
jgi:hypothetical protein